MTSTKILQSNETTPQSPIHNFTATASNECLQVASQMNVSEITAKCMCLNICFSSQNPDRTVTDSAQDSITTSSIVITENKNRHFTTTVPVTEMWFGTGFECVRRVFNVYRLKMSQTEAMCKCFGGNFCANPNPVPTQCKIKFILYSKYLDLRKFNASIVNLNDGQASHCNLRRSLKFVATF